MVVHTEDGNPFWAWSGEVTQVRLGGGDSDELNQADLRVVRDG